MTWLLILYMNGAFLHPVHFETKQQCESVGRYFVAEHAKVSGWRGSFAAFKCEKIGGEDQNDNT